ncbi:MAG: hypothetical protein V4640_10950 [Verrucomicrobiota bacterium]
MVLHSFDYQEFLINGGHWIDANRRLWIAEHRGKTGLRDLRETLLGMVHDVAWSSGYHGLTDLRDATLELSVNEVIRLGLLMRQPQLRTQGWLIYVVADETAHGVMRMLGHWSRTAERQRIFRSRQEAEKWLDGQRHRVPLRFLDERPDHFLNAS